MQQLIVSMMRLSAAATLFGMEQIQHSMEVLEGNEDISKMIRRFARTLDSVSDAFAGGIDARKRDALKSITRASEQIVEKSVDGLTLIDPREAVRASSDLVKHTSSSAASWINKTAASAEKESEKEPVNLDEMTVEEVLNAVDSGKLTAEEAIQEEKKGKNRTTLISALESKHVDVGQMTVEEVLAAVDSGKITPEEAIQAEKKGKNRATLLTALEIENMTVEEVLSAVDSSKITAEEAIRAEKKGKSRATLISALESKI
ncbi:MAG TPA: hypothetical protein VGL91_23285 [Acidobacteriota bacterium]